MLKVKEKYFKTDYRPADILLNFYNESQTKCTISQIYLVKYATCFGQVHCPSSRAPQHCIHAIGICHASYVGICKCGQDGTHSILTTLADHTFVFLISLSLFLRRSAPALLTSHAITDHLVCYHVTSLLLTAARVEK
jgi:hypothetical protein